MSNDNGNEIVYVLTNPAMPGLTKIGKTRQEDVETRLGQLYTSGCLSHLNVSTPARSRTVPRLKMLSTWLSETSA